MIGLAALLAFVGTANNTERLGGPAWTKLSSPPRQMDLYCAAYDHQRQWTVAIRGGLPIVTVKPPPRPRDPLPFPVPKHEDRSGGRHVLKTPGGWLVGFDDGEFGGGFWFTDGSVWLRLEPPADSPSNPQDPFEAQNVQGLATVDGHVLVLMGLDHLTGRSGRIFTVASNDSQYSLGSGAALDSSPGPWQVVGDHLEVVTEGGLWRVTPDGRALRVSSVDLSMLYPRSLAVGPDGRRYIGLRRYVLVLEQDGGAWRETWYGPKNCPRSRKDDREQCSCLVGPATQ